MLRSIQSRLVGWHSSAALSRRYLTATTDPKAAPAVSVAESFPISPQEQFSYSLTASAAPMFVVDPSEVQKQFHVMSLAPTATALNVVWSDGHKSTFDYFWLRDNCHCAKCHHPVADERMLDTCSIPDSIEPKLVEDKGTFLRIHWKSTDHMRTNEHISDYDLRFLRENCISPLLARTQAYEGRLWKASDMAAQLPSINFADVMNREEAFTQWLDMIRTVGFSVIREVPTDGDGYAGRVAQRISFLRTTFWGDSWSVRSEPNPKNLSLTGEELFPHTDFTWSETPPGLQFLHCVEFKGGEGGDSTLVDGYAVAEHLRHNDPESFQILRDVPIRHYFTSDNESYSFAGPTIKLDERGLVQLLRFNQANRAPIEADPEMVRPIYRALNKLAMLLRSPEFLLHLKLKEGDMLVFNNHRLLHGRLRYDAQTTVRHLKGCYLDWDQFQSKYSIMNAARAKIMAKGLHNQPQHLQQSRLLHTSAAVAQNPQSHIDPGFDKYSDEFVREALAPYKQAIESGEHYEDGSQLSSVFQSRQPSFTAMKEGTKADYMYQCALFQKDIETNLSNRLFGMLQKLEGDHIRLGTGSQVDLFEHSIQSATRAQLDGADEELQVVALLHDIGEMMSPMNHGEIAGAILRPYISPENYWILTHHEVFQVGGNTQQQFQGYYYFHHCGGNRDTREIYSGHPQYQATVDFCEKYDQCSFDPNFESHPVEFFRPALEKVLRRQPYWHMPSHPKLGVVSINSDDGQRPENKPGDGDPIR